MPRRRFELLVCDLDNTLYDWVDYFVVAFHAMVDEAVAILGCDREELLDDLKEVHRRHHDSEHPFALLETRLVQTAFPDKTNAERKAILDSAFLAFNRSRKSRLKLYDGVAESLEAMKAAGVRLVAHTESKTWAAIDRLTRLRIDHHFDRLYCRRRAATQHPSPDKISNRFETFEHRLVELARHERKPSPEVLRGICAKEAVAPRNAAYVGDSMARDMVMAKKAGVFAIWAAYGAKYTPRQYEQLVRVTHWTDEDVVREKQLKAQAARVKPDFVCRRAFSDLVPVILEQPEKQAIGG